MPNVKIGVQTRSLRQPIKLALRTAAQLGAAGVEIDARSELLPSQLSQTGLREFRKLLDDANLRVSAVAFPTRRGYDVADDLERRVLATQTAMRLAADLRSEVLIIRVGRVPGENDPAGANRLIEALTALGVYGDQIGTRLALQTVEVSPENLGQLLKKLPEHCVGVDLHAGGLLAGGHSPQEAVEMLGPYVAHVHACDAARDAATRQVVEVPLGRGSADFPELLGRLTEFNYRGWVTIERRETADPIGDIENAVAYLSSL